MDLPQLGMVVPDNQTTANDNQYMNIYFNGTLVSRLGPEDNEEDLVHSCLLYATYFYQHENIKPH